VSRTKYEWSARDLLSLHGEVKFSRSKPDVPLLRFQSFPAKLFTFCPEKALVYLTIFIQLFSLNVLDKSVAISMPSISTHRDRRDGFRLMNSSLQMTAAAAPSLVGLNKVYSTH
jgi:hypothetical protein